MELLVFLGCLRLVDGCGGDYEVIPPPPQYYYNPPPPSYYSDNTAETTTEGVILSKEAEKKKQGSFGGFDVPNDVKKALKEWIEVFQAKQGLENLHNDSGGFEKDRDKASGWPFEWGGLGSGHPGFPPDPPPPHAFQPPNHKGVPPYCFLPPHRGRCNYTLTRWYYHPYMDQCMLFNYTGCGGNSNKYETELACEKECMEQPASGCDPDTNIYVEEYGIEENRRRQASDPFKNC